MKCLAKPVNLDVVREVYSIQKKSVIFYSRDIYFRDKLLGWPLVFVFFMENFLIKSCFDQVLYLCILERLWGSFCFSSKWKLKMSASGCRNFLTSWLTGSQAYRGNVDTPLPIGTGWMQSWPSEAVGAMPLVRGPSTQPGDQRYIFAGKFSLDRSFAFHWCSVHWILWWGEKMLFTLWFQFSLTAIPICLWDLHPKFSSLWTAHALWKGLSFTLGWKPKQLKFGRVFPHICCCKTPIPYGLIGIVEYHVSQTEIQI